jgi:hypothetical protein
LIRASVACACAVTLLLTGATLLFASVALPTLQRNYRARQPGSDIDQYLKVDPPGGSRLSLVGWQFKGKTVVIWMGDCTPCSVDKLKSARLDRAMSSLPILLVGDKSRIGEVLRRFNSKGWAGIAASDPERKQWNAFFSPRAYYVDAGGTLISTQSPYDLLGHFVAGCRP